MGIETLNSAAHAAGFAMAGLEEDDTFEDDVAAANVIASPWGPRQSMAVRTLSATRMAATKMAATKTDWLALFLGLFGRRTPARRPALTAEA